MASRNAQLADAVKAALNAAPSGTFVLPFTAKRVAVASNDLAKLKALTVSVIPYADDSERVARDLDDHTLAVYVGIEKQLASADPSQEKANTEIDQLMLLVEQINDFFDDDTIALDVGQFIESKIIVLSDPPALLTYQLFRGVIAVRFFKAVG